MKLPPNFARELVMGSKGRRSSDGWRVRVFDKGAYIPRAAVLRPGAVRQLLSAVLGIKPEKTQEEILRKKARQSAHIKRQARLLIEKRKAEGKEFRPPWARPRTLAKIIAEECTLSTAQKWSNMGEYRK